MQAEIVEVKPLEDYKLCIRFKDGKTGIVDIAKIVPFKGVFAKLKDKKYFDTVKINLGTICWKNGADIAPYTLFQNLKTSKTHDEMVAEWMKDPLFKAEYDALEEEYQLLREMLHARKHPDLSQKFDS